ncbi:hypothetical protein NHX12_003267, partial [Muraenolepis orangiensis]
NAGAAGGSSPRCTCGHAGVTVLAGAAPPLLIARLIAFKLLEWKHERQLKQLPASVGRDTVTPLTQATGGQRREAGETRRTDPSCDLPADERECADIAANKPTGGFWPIPAAGTEPRDDRPGQKTPPSLPHTDKSVPSAADTGA